MPLLLLLAGGGDFVLAAVPSTVQITWSDNSDSEDGFSVERSSVSGDSGFSQISTVAAGGSIYNDSGLAAGTYWYRVRAFTNSGAYSSYTPSASISVT